MINWVDMRNEEHFMDRFFEKIGCLPITRIEKENLLKHIMELKRTLYGEVGVMVKKFNRDVVKHDPNPRGRDEDETWVIIRNGIVRTILRRDSNHTFNTNVKSMNVDRLIYQPI